MGSARIPLLTIPQNIVYGKKTSSNHCTKVFVQCKHLGPENQLV